MRPDEKSLQEKYAPKSICFGCGPANPKGLHIRSFVDGDDVVAQWTPEPHHAAFDGMLNGGIIGTLLDCHCNWAAAWHIMNHNGEKHPPCTVTAKYEVKFLRPTPVDGPVRLVARLKEIREDRAVITGKLIAKDGKASATCEGTFVAVKEGHPAYHRW